MLCDQQVEDDRIPWFLPESLLWVPLSSCKKITYKVSLRNLSTQVIFLRLVRQEFDQEYGITSKGPGIISFVSLLLYNTLAILNLLKSNCWSWEDGSGGKVPAMLA